MFNYKKDYEERENILMKRSKLVDRLRSVLSLLMVLSVVAGTIAVPTVQAAAYEDSYIKQLTDLAIDYSDYIDSSVMYALPESVRNDEDISVIVTLDVPDIMSSYEKTNKAMSFSEYATQSNDASAIKAEISAEKEQMLAALSEQGISYSAGEEYSTILSGFEIIIKAGDFEATCQALGEGMDVIVGEVYNTCETELVENAVNVDSSTGIFESSGAGYDGSGMVVAVLDTGLDSNHTAFSPDNFTSENIALTYDDVASVINDTAASEQFTGLTVDDVYINEKVPYGFDYADNDTDGYSTHNNHGTHVSGVIVGKDDTIRGVAPKAQ